MKILETFSGLILLTGITLISIQVKAQSSKFNGGWGIITNKSDFGGIEPKKAAPKQIKVSTSVDSMIINRVFEDQQPFFEALKFEADDAVTFPDNNTVKFSAMHWDEGSKKIVFNATYEVNGAEIVYWRTEKWQLKGKLLQVERITTMRGKVDRVKAIYKRESW